MAEAIVAAQDAGLVETSIDPPPILDILITGRATDLRTLKNTTAQEAVRRQPRGLRRLVHRLRHARGHRLRPGRPDRQPQRRAQAVVRPARRDPEERHRGVRKAKARAGTQASGGQEGRDPGTRTQAAETKTAEAKKALTPPPPTATKPAEPKK